MKRNLMRQIANFINEHRQKKRWYQVVTVLAAVVVFATTYSMILPAITMTNTATASNCATGSNASTSSANSVHTGSNALVPTPSNAILYRCGLEEHMHDDDCYDADGKLICELEEHEHVAECYYPELFTIEMIEYMDALVAVVEKLPNIEVVKEYKALEYQERFDEADALLAQEMNIDLEEGTYPYEIVEVMIGTALESYTNALNLFIDEYPGMTSEEFDAILADDYIYGPAYDGMKEFIGVWYGTVTLVDVYDASARDDDISVVSGDGITFALFDYSDYINRKSDSTAAAWRTIQQYFNFRNSNLKGGEYTDNSQNKEHDIDGYTKTHATVERKLDDNRNPVLDLTRNADGTTRTDPDVSAEVRSLAYLFSDQGDHAVTAYNPSNTILQKSGNHYWYDSKNNAVDYDIANKVFRVRKYAEWNSTTAGYPGYADFMPFTYTGGVKPNENVNYHVKSDDVNYWYGMTMEFDFFQTKGGLVDEEAMVFNFSGDDDVWVFVDDVLVLDLGGTHGTVTGSINFATGEIKQYLSWSGGTADSTTTSFPTTLRKCFDAADVTPNGGWNGEGEAFADYTRHTLKFFYLERGAAVANCKIDFRLPTLPSKSLTVTKELVAGENTEVDQFITDSLSYQFRVVKTDDSGNPTEELFIKAGENYKILDGSMNEVGNGTVASGGIFTLKAGQSAQFENMLEKGEGAKAYIVQEIMPTGLTGQYSSVQYTVGPTVGELQNGTELSENFTSFNTCVMDAEAEVQTVTYRNKVDITKLGQLQISKVLANGADLPADKTFQMYVELGGEPIAKGTEYVVTKEGAEPKTKEVSEGGFIELCLGETATITKGIISGTAYTVKETPGTGYTASYTGTVTSMLDDTLKDNDMESDVTNGVTGTFPLASKVHVTVANADYNFQLDIPINKTCLDNTVSSRFNFLVEQGKWDDNIGWTMAENGNLPGTVITVTDAEKTAGTITIGYKSGDSGEFQYKIQEKNAGGYFIYDTNFYIVDVRVENGEATITSIRKNGTEVIDITDSITPLEFINRSTTALIVTKKVDGVVTGSDEVAFPFKVVVNLDGKAFEGIPESEKYEVNGNEITFTLKHGDSIEIPSIPKNAVVTVEETNHDGFVAYCQVVGRDSVAVCQSNTEITFGNSPITVNFTNFAGNELPSTGGNGTTWHTFSGLLLVATAMIFGFVQRRRRERRAN